MIQEFQRYGLQQLVQETIAFRPKVWRKLRWERRMTPFAIAVLVLASFASGLGTYIWIGREFSWSGEAFWKSAIVGSVLMAAGWLGALVIAWLLLRRQQQGMLFEEVLRVGSAASVPLALGFFVFIPELGLGIGVLSAGLAAVTLATALQVALNVPPGRAFAAAMPGFAFWCLVLPLFVTSDDPLAAGVFGFEWGIEGLFAIRDALAALSAALR